MVENDAKFESGGSGDTPHPFSRLSSRGPPASDQPQVQLPNSTAKARKSIN